MSVVALTVPLELADGGAAYSGSATGVGDIIVVQTSGYNSISIQLTGTWVATVNFSVSNDGTNWVTIASESANGLYSYATTGLYFKVSVSAYTSGTVNALAYLRFQPVVDVLQADAGSVPQTASVSANGNFLSLDTLGYNSISVQLSGFWVAALQFQASNDNVNWTPVQGYAFNSTVSATDTVVDNDIYVLPVVGRYFRVSVSNYQSGPIGVTAYLRTQSLAGIGEAALTQAMDQSGMTPLNVTLPGVTGAGQQNAANSVPVALANEQVQDKYISGKAWTQSTTYLNYNMLLTPEQAAIDPAAPIDCLQYRSICIQFNSGGSASATNTVSATFVFEASNDLVNWTNVTMWRPEGGSAVGVNNIRNFNPINYGASGTFVGALTARYFRVRCSSFTSTGFIQFTTVLRMIPFTTQVESFTNIVQQGGSGLAAGVVNFNTAVQTVSTTGGTQSTGVSPLIFGASDRSVVRQEMLGAPINPAVTAYNFNGPWTRQTNVDVAGGLTVSGPVPWLAEEKTAPVNVRLERTTWGQDSVQDLLLEVLAEMKALNYYTRETPLAIARALSTAVPTSYPSMQDDPENFYDDPSSFNTRKGY